MKSPSTIRSEKYSEEFIRVGTSWWSSGNKTLCFHCRGPRSARWHCQKKKIEYIREWEFDTGHMPTSVKFPLLFLSYQEKTLITELEELVWGRKQMKRSSVDTLITHFHLQVVCQSFKHFCGRKWSYQAKSSKENTKKISMHFLNIEWKSNTGHKDF